MTMVETKAAVELGRPHPQWTFLETTIDPDSFFGRIRSIYASTVLKTQLEQLKRSGCYDMFTGKWMPCYDTRRIYGAKALPNGLPPSLFWESDIGKWIESASYFLAGAKEDSPHREEFSQAIDKLISEMEAFQAPDGYLNVYFTVVDPAGRFQNLRDMHEMYNAGHLLEGAIAHYRFTGSSRFLDIMIKNVDCFMKAFGPAGDQRPGYPGHPEFELAMLRLYAVTKDPRHLHFAEHLLAARGTSSSELKGERFFMWEAKERNDEVYGCWMKDKADLAYHQAHKPIHEQEAILGHSVRAMYLLTACADFGADFFEDAKRLWADATQKKMYVTGGFGSEPQSEGFSELPYYLPSSTGEGGCYAETCASIGAMMLTERILSRELDGKYRDVLELCLYNAVLGGGSLDGKGFSYANKLATYGDESALRAGWFEVCCCPPNLSRTLGILPGYIWSTHVQPDAVVVDIFLYISAKKVVELTGSNSQVEISMISGMPWNGDVKIEVKAPEGVKVLLRLPTSDWMSNLEFSTSVKPVAPGYVQACLDASSPSISISYVMETRLVYPHPDVKQDTLSVMRGPIVFVAEDADNAKLEDMKPHFERVGLSDSATFTTSSDTIANVPVLRLSTNDAYILSNADTPIQAANGAATNGTSAETVQTALWNTVKGKNPVRSWARCATPLVFIPWFARGNRGGKGHLRVPFLRVGQDQISETDTQT